MPALRHALEFISALEVGHIFKLGRKFTNSLGVTVTGPDGTAIVPVMGCYGIGVERAIAAIAEVHHDDAGLVWPVQVAPAEVDVIMVTARTPRSRRRPRPCTAACSTRGCRPCSMTGTCGQGSSTRTASSSASRSGSAWARVTSPTAWSRSPAGPPARRSGSRSATPCRPAGSWSAASPAARPGESRGRDGRLTCRRAKCRRRLTRRL